MRIQALVFLVAVLPEHLCPGNKLSARLSERSAPAGNRQKFHVSGFRSFAAPIEKSCTLAAVLISDAKLRANGSLLVGLVSEFRAMHQEPVAAQVSEKGE